MIWKTHITPDVIQSFTMTSTDIQYDIPSMHRAHRRVHVMTHTVPNGAQLVEGLDVEPGAFISSSVQHHPHGVLLQQSRQTLVHCQVFVALQVEELSGDRIQRKTLQTNGHDGI